MAIILMRQSIMKKTDLNKTVKNAIYMFDKDNGEPEVLDETEAVESAGDVAETAATAEAVEDISDATRHTRFKW